MSKKVRAKNAAMAVRQFEQAAPIQCEKGRKKGADEI